MTGPALDLGGALRELIAAQLELAQYVLGERDLARLESLLDQIGGALEQLREIEPEGGER